MCDEGPIVIYYLSAADGEIMELLLSVDQTLNHSDFFFFGVPYELLFEVFSRATTDFKVDSTIRC